MKRHICAGLAGWVLLLGTAWSSQATGLIITGVIDGPLAGGLPKAVELYASDDISDLSIYGMGFANNGGGSDGIEFTFSVLSAVHGDFFYVAADIAEFKNFFGFNPDAITSAVNINGDDAVELFRNGAVVDVFGDIAADGTGQSWEYLDGWAYRNNATCQDSSFFMVSDWYFSGVNALDDEFSNLTANSPFPAGSFQQHSSPRPVPTPEPATILLFGSAIAGAAGKRLRPKKGKIFRRSRKAI